MTGVPLISTLVEARLRDLMAAVLPPEAAGADPMIRQSDFADFQADGIFALGRALHTNPRALATTVASAWEQDDVLVGCEVSGPGYLNLTVSDAALLRQLQRRAEDPRLGVPVTDRRVTVVDYSQPNIAKEMHVGHLRSTVIGDALTRILSFSGGKVIRQNHLGDWGTQFGMLIEHLEEHPDLGWQNTDDEPPSTSSLNMLYREARAKFEADTGFADRARSRVVALQSGDARTVSLWRDIVDESKRYFRRVYERLGVLLTEDDEVGESFYNPHLADVVDHLESMGVAQVSEGSLCVFFEDVRGREGEPIPLIVRKRDGGFGYAATDLAAIRYRLEGLGADRLLYVVDARQALHFRMVFETARMAGWLRDPAEAEHVAFGSSLGPDGKPFKTRAGDVVTLIELLDQAVARARSTIVEKNGHLGNEEIEELAQQVGVGAVKYADLSTNRIKDYVFDLDRMVSLTGNTGVYLQYAHARVRSILRRLPQAMPVLQIAMDVGLEPRERALAMLLDDFTRPILEVRRTLEPHHLCVYLFGLARTFTDFYESCPVVHAASDEIRARRVLLCVLTADTLKLGLDLLGIAAPDRL